MRVSLIWVPQALRPFLYELVAAGLLRRCDPDGGGWDRFLGAKAFGRAPDQAGSRL